MYNIYKSTKYYIPDISHYDPIGVTVTYRLLSFKEVTDLSALQKNLKYNQFLVKIFETSLINIYIENITNPTIDLLPYDFQKNIATEILNHSSLSEDDIKKINISVDVFFSKTLSTKTWECTECQRKGLDKERNCPILGEEKKNPNFVLSVDNVVYTFCPKGKVDMNIVSKGIEAYNIFKAGYLPEAGGWVDQTYFFCYISQYINNKIEERKIQDLKNN